ncbi:MAG TPA: glycosyltransferase [Ferruginibacter sp.]|nr:glycosyltransferase [Ferruginibacter sp.]HMP19798.1 glycosyltransferase [Ferruginibacter sp.]
MVIAVNTRLLQEGSANITWYVHFFVQWAAAQPQHQFVFITHQPNQPQLPPNLPNLQLQVLPQQSRRPLLWKWWYNYKLPALLRSIKADIVFHPDMVCSLRTKLPQGIFINTTPHEAQAWLEKNYSHYIQANTYRFIQKAALLIVPVSNLQKDITKSHPATASKIVIVPPYPIPATGAATWEQRQETKERYAAGKEYFLFISPLHNGSNFIHLLKAFSFFKKRQKSNMQLVILAPQLPPKNKFITSLQTYKYRHDVQLLQHKDANMQQHLLSAAYAMVQPTLYDDAPLLLQAMQCGVPVIAAENATVKELLEDTVLYCDKTNFNSTAQLMMHLYKDETARTMLIEAARKHSSAFTLDTTLSTMVNTLPASGKK